MGNLIALGCDVGQRTDPSAIVVVEVAWRTVPVEEDGRSRLARAIRLPAGTTLRPLVRREAVFSVRHIEAVPLGTLYVDVAERIAEVVASARERHPPTPPELRVDITGVGRPVVELIGNALRDRRIFGSACKLIGVTFTFGQKYEARGTEATLGKGYLVSRLQALIQTKRIELPRSAEAMVDELLNYEIKVDPDGDAKLGAFRVGTHDDLVTALGLAVLEDPRESGGPTTLRNVPSFAGRAGRRLVTDATAWGMPPATWPRW
jgi:hypothetical protein